MLKRWMLIASGTIVGAVAFPKFVRPWYRHWGATEEEIARPMPLDERVPRPTAVSTRAVTVEARPERIWPWIAQMGDKPRAGYYSYVWIERLQGMDVENSERVLTEYQAPAVGDSLDKQGNMKVLGVDPGRYLALGPPENVDWLRSTWVVAIYPRDEISSRLVTRVRARMSIRGMMRAVPPFLWPLWLVLDPGVFIMERKMLIEIRKRAERLSRVADAQLVHGV